MKFKQSAIAIVALFSGVFSTQARSIQGTIMSSADSTAIAGVECRLIADGKDLATTVSGADGNFSLEINSKIAVNLEIEKKGFYPAYITIAQGSGNLNVGVIYLDKSVTLDEVTVTADAVINSNGKTIVYPSIADVKSSSTALSLFQKLPLAGLQANPVNRTMSVDGGSPVILINGVPSSMDDVNALQPKDIAKVEFSRLTPARYADKGNSGLLSITLKKRNDGGQIYAWGRSAVNTTFMDANIRASYHQGASQFTLMYNPSWRNYHRVYDNITKSYIGDGFRVNLEEHDRAPFNYHMHPVKLKYDLSPSTKTLFSATFNMTPIWQKSSAFNHTIDSEMGVYDNENRSTSKDLSPSLDLFLRQDFNDRNSLEAQVVGTLSSSDYRRDNTYTFDNDETESYLMNVDSRRKSLISEISYIHNFSDKTQLSGGYQNTVSHSTNTYLSSDYKPVLTENNNYVYARLGQRIGKVYLSVATGAKMFWIKNDMNRRHFIRNLTTVQGSWTINQKWSLQGSFQYTPSIPSLSALTDYPQQSTPYLISNGNPDLKVADNLRYRLSASYSHKAFSIWFQSSYSDIKNRVISDIIYIGDNKFLSQSVNARKSGTFSNDLSFRLNDIHGFGANLYMNLSHYNCAGSDWKHSLTSFSGSISLWWNKGPFTVSYWRSLPGKYLNGHYVGKEENGDALQLDYTPNKHWTFGASWMYMFEKKGTQYPAWNYSEVNPYYRERYIKDNGNMIVLSVSYSADFGSIFKTAKRNLNNSDNGSSLLKM